MITDFTDLSEFIELHNGRALMKGRRLPIMFVVESALVLHMPIDAIALDFSITREQVLAALLYYREHKAELDDQTAADEIESTQMHAANTQTWTAMRQRKPHTG